MNNWDEKLKGVLHDPPYKFLDIKGHEKNLTRIYETLGLTDTKAQGDVLASSMDRFLFPEERKYCNNGRICLDFLGKNAVWKHTLGGSKEVIKPFNKMSSNEATDTARALSEKFMKDMIEPVKDLKVHESKLDYKRMFLKMWWDMPSWIRKNIGTELIPADTRIPNHSITDHLFSTSSLSGVKEKAFIFFSIGPVQSFISSARKTTDLWAGSYLLSDLSMECMLTVADEFGPDSIVFPDLHSQARVKKWLEDQKVPLSDSETLDEYLPSVPNRFIAIVEFSEAENLAKKVEERLKAKWEEISNGAKEYFKRKNQLEDEELFDRQISTFPEFYYETFKWPSKVENTKKIFNTLFGKKIEKSFEYGEFIKNLEYISKNSNTYNQNVGPYYGFFFEIARRFLDSTKMTTPIPSYNGKDGIDKDTISGSFEWVVKYPSQEEDDADEKLNALDAVKRYCVDELYKDVVKKGFEKFNGVPSTTDIALGKLLPRENEREIKEDGAKIAVLVMDGDHMGHWISGKSAPSWKDAFSDETMNHATFKKYVKDDFLESKRVVYPAYHRTISKALSTFTKYVGRIVSYHGGLLIYAGGDDVMAFLPAAEVFECANDLRKVFSGNYFEIEDDKTDTKTTFKNGFVFENGRPVAQLMGLNSSMSAGIAVGHHKYPLAELLKHARQAEHEAKEKGGRNAFCLHTIRRSGQISVSTSKWDYVGNDVISLAENILTYVTKKKESEKIKVSPKLIKTLVERRLYPKTDDVKKSYYSVIPDMKLMYEEDEIDLYLKNLIKRRMIAKKDKDSDKKLLEYLSEKLCTFLTPSKDEKGESKNKFIIDRTNLLNEMLFAKRGDDR